MQPTDRRLANAIRALAMDAVETANSGHPGMPMGKADAATALCSRHLMEGVNHEAIGLAGHLELGRLIVLWDDNSITIDGSTDLSRNEDVVARHRAARWHTCECDGLDADDVDRAIREALADPRPSLI